MSRYLDACPMASKLYGGDGSWARSGGSGYCGEEREAAGGGLAVFV